MDQMIADAARALASGDALSALKRVALRDDAPALAVRGIAMAQLGDLTRARDLLHRAARAFGSQHPLRRARCVVAEAEIALVTRELGRSWKPLHAARQTLAAAGDRANAAHAGYIEARRLLLIGQLDDAQAVLDDLDERDLPPVSLAGRELVMAGIASRRVKAGPARAALGRARQAAETAGIAALISEVDDAVRVFEAPAARLITHDTRRLVDVGEVETLFTSDALVVDACRNTVRTGSAVISLGTRPVLFAVVRALAESWPSDVSREALLRYAFGAKQADESHRARLRVEIARLREAIQSMTALDATRHGFILRPHGARDVVVLAPPVEGDHANVLALLSDGQSWSSSALAVALGVSARTVQRALEKLADDGKVESVGRGRACRWMAQTLPGFPTNLLLPTAGMFG